MSRKVLRRAGIAILAVIVILVVVGFFLPRQPIVSRSIAVAATPDAVYAVVSDLRRFNDWSPWYGRDPDAVYTFTGPADGVGQTMRWESDMPEVGSGTMTIAALDPDSQVDIDLDFGDQGLASTWVTIAPEGEGANVTWAFTTDFGYNPIARYLGMMIDDMIGGDYETGLEKLKAVVEQPAETDEDELG
ncbi:SRPBCC family protein [Bauldia sp.]|uniref:SRPBCC family protein n=1 Tax=Bauldia sp. TaxID=2575872 RepID=UPI003BAD447E